MGTVGMELVLVLMVTDLVLVSLVLVEVLDRPEESSRQACLASES